MLRSRWSFYRPHIGTKTRLKHVPRSMDSSKDNRGLNIVKWRWNTLILHTVEYLSTRKKIPRQSRESNLGIIDYTVWNIWWQMELSSQSSQNRLPIALLQYCPVQGPNDFTVTLIFSSKNTILDSNIENVFVRHCFVGSSRMFKYHFLHGVVPELLFNQFLLVLCINMWLRVKESDRVRMI